MAMLLSVQSSSAVEDESSWPSPWPPVEDLEFPPPPDWLPLPPGEDRAMPGLPKGPEIYPGFSLNYGTTTQAISRSMARKTKQKFNIPKLNVVAALSLNDTALDDACKEVMPGVNGVDTIRTYQYASVVDSPEDAANEWGDFPPFTVNNIAFGAVPAKATIQLRQTRRPDGLPMPMEMTTREYQGSASEPCGVGKRNYLYDQMYLTGRVDVNLMSLTVDGVDVPLGGKCRATEPAEIEVSHAPEHSPDVSGFHPALPPSNTTKRFNARLGGLLSGTIDIAPFVDCGKNEDLDPLLTALISGPDNPVEVRTQAVSGQDTFSPTNPPIYGKVP